MDSIVQRREAFVKRPVWTCKANNESGNPFNLSIYEMRILLI